MESRRDFIRLASASLGALLIGGAGRARAQPEPSLIVQLEALCRRLAPLGWQEMMLAVTGGALDIAAPDLARELAKPVAVDRTYPGFGDFALAGNRGVEPGRPDESLLYHALAAPTVVSDPAGRKLGGFPTVEEIDTVENYIYATRAATLDELHAAAKLRIQTRIEGELGKCVVGRLDGHHAPVRSQQSGHLRASTCGRRPWEFPPTRCVARLPARLWSGATLPADA